MRQVAKFLRGNREWQTCRHKVIMVLNWYENYKVSYTLAHSDSVANFLAWRPHLSLAPLAWEPASTSDIKSTAFRQKIEDTNEEDGAIRGIDRCEQWSARERHPYNEKNSITQRKKRRLAQLEVRRNGMFGKGMDVGSDIECTVKLALHESFLKDK